MIAVSRTPKVSQADAGAVARLCAVTTSWDDGHPRDLRVAEALCRRGMQGTFYVPRQSRFTVMSNAEIRQLHRMGMEVGGHTHTHCDLTTLDETGIATELKDGKAWLEDVLGAEVTSIAYPFGRYDRRVCRQAARSGYVLGRTADHLDIGLSFDPFRMPVSFQCYPHGPLVHFRHAMKAGRLAPLAHWLARDGGVSDLSKLGAAFWRAIQARGQGVWHLWGHSWEVEDCDLWQQLDALLELVAGQEGASYLTNSEVAAAR